jgi:K+-sensing histidine kinase KdpD
VLSAVHQTLDAPVVSLLRESFPGFIECEAVHGVDADPLASTELAQPVLQRMLGAAEGCLAEDLQANGLAVTATSCRPYRYAVGAPIAQDGERAVLLAYAPEPDGSFEPQDLRFLTTVAAHLATGLEKARLHRQLANHRDELETTVAERTAELSKAYGNLRRMELMKDRFLGNLSHEMKTPLAAILSAAHVIRDYKSSTQERRELVDNIVTSAETLDRQLEDLFRLVNLEKNDRPAEFAGGEPERLVQRAIQISGHSGVRYEIGKLPLDPVVDEELLARALANLIDNAVKFSPPGSLLEVVVTPGRLAEDADPADAMVVSVLDRGYGVAEEDRERIFAPFEQGGEPLTSKPRGVGLGLHEARIVAHQHGGELEYHPREGEGSEFRLVVPLRPAGVVLETGATEGEEESIRV